jgi:hypothetical protein
MQQSTWWVKKIERESQHGDDKLDGEMHAVNEELIESLIVTVSVFPGSIGSTTKIIIENLLVVGDRCDCNSLWHYWIWIWI